MTFLAIVFAVLAGLSNPFQSGTNAELNKQLGSPLWATIIVYSTALGGLLLAQLFLRQAFPAHARTGSVPWWAWCGGLISLLPTIAGLVLAQRLGSGVFTGLTITCSLVCSVVLDQFGWLGFQQHTATPLRLAGCVLMVVGVWLVSRF